MMASANVRCAFVGRNLLFRLVLRFEGKGGVRRNGRLQKEGRCGVLP
jgi:hypothetical protein